MTLFVVIGCGGSGAGKGPDGGGGSGGAVADGAAGDAAPGSDGPVAQSQALVVTAVDPTFVTEDHFIASIEMQLSGEPLAEAMGRDLSGFSRNYACQDAVCQASVYADPALAATAMPESIDLVGFSSGIESYEYSKQPMNNIAFESGAGTSLLFGPVVNPGGATGTDALALAQAWFQHMASGSNLSAGFFAPRISISACHVTSAPPAIGRTSRMRLPSTGNSLSCATPALTAASNTHKPKHQRHV